MEILAIAVGVVTGLVILALLFRPFFEDLEGFLSCVKFWLTPDIFSAFKGEYYDDYFAEMKLILWLFLGIGTGFGSYFGMLKFV